MSIFGSFLVLLLILVEAAPPTASSVPKLGRRRKPLSFSFWFNIRVDLLLKDQRVPKRILRYIFCTLWLLVFRSVLLLQHGDHHDVNLPLHPGRQRVSRSRRGSTRATLAEIRKLGGGGWRDNFSHGSCGSVLVFTNNHKLSVFPVHKVQLQSLKRQHEETDNTASFSFGALPAQMLIHLPSRDFVKS